MMYSNLNVSTDNQLRILAACLLASLLMGCQPNQTQSAPLSDQVTADTQAFFAQAEHMSELDTDANLAVPASTRNQPLNLDWTVFDDKARAPLEDYPYPFDQNSQAVLAYADYYELTPAQAQHNLTLAMASNEPLEALLDQLADSYVSHKLEEADSVQLVLHTTPNVTPSQFDYVITGDFGRGLVLPIVVKPIAAKPASKPIDN